MRIAILTSHVIQYQTPLFRKLAAVPGIELIVYFCWDFGAKETYDPEFGHAIEWDIPLQEGYHHSFLKNFSLKPSPSFFGQINPGIFSVLSKRKCDALIAYGWNSITNWLAFLTAFVRNIPVFLHGENPLNQELLKSSWKRGVKKMILGWLFRHISRFLYIGEENKKFYEYYGVPKGKLFFTPYAVDNERYVRAADALHGKKVMLKNEIGISSDQPVILFVGKLIEKKRPFDLLRAYEKVATSGKSPILVFVGDGVLRPRLEHYAREKGLTGVRFEGFQNQSELPRWYALADVFVLPSGVGETWGLVVNEAMCFRLPVIVSSMVGCGPDLARHNENGFVFQCGDIYALAEHLRTMIENKKLAESFGGRSREIIGGYSHIKDIEGIQGAIRSLKFDH